MLVRLPNPWNIDLWLLKSDETRPHLGGNKYHKLRGYLATARKEGTTQLVTMAAAHSNHLRAFAALCRRERLSGTALIRGEELTDTNLHSAELQYAAGQGVDLHFISRAAYRQLREAGHAKARAAIVPDLSWDKAVYVPEGGHGAAGTVGVADWAREAAGFASVYIACATGTTCAGFLLAAHPNQQVCGVSVLNNADAVRETIRALATGHEKRFELVSGYTLGGFARQSDELLKLCAEFSELWQVTIDPTYMGRVLMALRDRTLAGKISGRVLVVYTYNE